VKLKRRHKIAYADHPYGHVAIPLKMFGNFLAEAGVIEQETPDVFSFFMDDSQIDPVRAARVIPDAL
jgi:hypothetical protein